MVRSLMRMVEPEWSDATREDAEALAEYEREICSGCGIHPVILANPDQHHLEFEDHYCAMCRAQARRGRKVYARDEDFVKKHPKAGPEVFRPNDGLHVRLRTLTPDEVHERKLKKGEG